MNRFIIMGILTFSVNTYATKKCSEELVSPRTPHEAVNDFDVSRTRAQTILEYAEENDLGPRFSMGAPKNFNSVTSYIDLFDRISIMISSIHLGSINFKKVKDENLIIQIPSDKKENPSEIYIKVKSVRDKTDESSYVHSVDIRIEVAEELKNRIGSGKPSYLRQLSDLWKLAQKITANPGFALEKTHSERWEVGEANWIFKTNYTIHLSPTYVGGNKYHRDRETIEIWNQLVSALLLSHVEKLYGRGTKTLQ